MLRKRSHPPRLLLAASALFFGAAYFTVSFPEVPGAWVGSFASTLLIAMPSFIALWQFLGLKRAALSLIALSAFGFAIEITGVATGFPYGTFYYGDSLGPKVAGLVPYILPLSWVPLVLGAVAASSPKYKAPQRYVLWVLAAAVLLTLVDGILDPGAASLSFWTWPEGGAYYGVPVTNYLGWLFSSTLAAALLLFLGRRGWGKETPPPGLLDSLVVAVAFWGGVTLFSGLFFPAALGGALFLYLLYRRARLAAGRGIKVSNGVENGGPKA